MNFKKLALGTAAAAMTIGTLGAAAHASVIDRPFFKVLGTVIVWSGDANGDKVVNDFILNTGAAAADTDLIGTMGVADGEAVVTGTLIPLDQSSVGSPYDADNDGVLDATIAVTDSIDGAVGAYTSSFFVASNTDFAINAVADNFQATGDFATDLGTTNAALADNITLEMDVVNSDAAQTFFGSKADLPYDDVDTAFGAYKTGGTADLSSLLTETQVFTGSKRTANAAGSIQEQSVRFDMTYNMQSDSGDAYDMSMGFGTLEAEVTYTVFVP